MKINIMQEIKNKHPVDSKKKGFSSYDIIPDGQNKDFCLNCKIDVKKCKGSKHCAGFKKEKENETLFNE